MLPALPFSVFFRIFRRCYAAAFHCGAGMAFYVVFRRRLINEAWASDIFNFLSFFSSSSSAASEVPSHKPEVHTPPPTGRTPSRRVSKRRIINLLPRPLEKLKRIKYEQKNNTTKKAEREKELKSRRTRPEDRAKPTFTAAKLALK